MSDSIEARLAGLEARMTALEQIVRGGAGQVAPIPQIEREDEDDPQPATIAALIRDKGLVHDEYQSFIGLHVDFVLRRDHEEIRSATGFIELTDPFGKPHFGAEITLTDRMRPGEALSWEGHMPFNEFMDDHQWMINTPLDAMRARFVTQQVMLLDGSIVDAPG